MDKKSRTSLERLQRLVDGDRPSEDERQRVADQLLTQDQLRRVDPRLKKLAALPKGRARKGPAAAPALASDLGASGIDGSADGAPSAQWPQARGAEPARRRVKEAERA